MVDFQTAFNVLLVAFSALAGWLLNPMTFTPIETASQGRLFYAH